MGWPCARTVCVAAALATSCSGGAGDSGPVPDGGMDAHTAPDAPPDAPPDADPQERAEPAPPVEFPGLTEAVEIRIDTLGVPHVYGSTDADVLHASGYQMARDRLFQMDLVRRRALGRQAEVFGEAKLDEDKLMRLLGFSRWAREDVRLLRQDHPEELDLLVAWVAGANRRIDEVLTGQADLPYGFGPGELDYQPQAWEAQDVLAIGRLILFANQNALERELLMSLLANQFPELLEVGLLRPMYASFAVPGSSRPQSLSAPFTRVPPPAGGASPDPGAAEHLRALRRLMAPLDLDGSNNWAVSGEHTENGRPLIAGDPHQSLQSPSLMYAQHLNSADGEGSLDVAGFSFVGAPGVHLGHNRRVVWTATNNFPDSMDILEVPRAGAGAVRLGGEEIALHKRAEPIRVRRSDDDGRLLQEWHESPFSVDEVPGHGVLLGSLLLPPALVTRNNGQLLFTWTGFRPTADGHVFFAMNQADSVTDFERALSASELTAFNFVVADSESLAYLVHARIPDRGHPADRQMPWLVVDGSDPAHVWSGASLPPEMLPRSVDPPEGYVATANNDPWGFTADGDVHNDPWYYGAFYAPGFRAHRIEQELQRLIAAGPVTVEQMQRLQLDVHSPLAVELVPLLQAALARAATDDTLAEFRDRPELDRLMSLLGSEWDGTMALPSAGAVAFHGLLMFLTRAVLADDIDPFFYDVLNAGGAFVIKVAPMSVGGHFDRADVLLDGDRDAVLLGALAETAAWLEERFGGVHPSLYRWGDVHGNHFGNPYGGRLTVGHVPTTGGEDTVNPATSRFFSGGSVRERFVSGSGAIYRMVGSFGDDGTPEVVVSWPPGNSGDPDSPHFRDRLAEWAEGVYRPLAFRRPDVESRTGRVLRLEPR